MLKQITLILLIGYLNLSWSMRCQQSLVYEGDTQYVVQQKCGEPLSKQVYDEPVILYNEYGAPYSGGSNTYEVWTYQKSPTDFLYEVVFQDGVVKSITSKRNPY